MCVFCQELVKMVSNQKDKREDRFPEPLKKCLAPKEKNFFSECSPGRENGNGKFSLKARPDLANAN